MAVVGMEVVVGLGLVGIVVVGLGVVEVVGIDRVVVEKDGTGGAECVDIDVAEDLVPKQ